MAHIKTIIHKPTTGRFKRLSDIIKNYLVEFCGQTNLHGFNHIKKNENSSIFKRLFFATVCCCSISLCLYLIALQVFNDNATLVISTITSTAYPIWKIPFPAVTVCNLNVVQKDNIPKFKKIMEPFEIDDDVMDDFLINLKSLVNFDELENASRYDEIFQALNSSGYGIDNMMQMLTKPCKLIIEKCFWQTHIVSCTEIFQQIKTTHGYCCSFNYFGIQEYVNNLTNIEKIRYRYAKGAGSTFSLQVHLKSVETQYISPILNSVGFTLQVQDPFNYPNLDYISSTLERNTLMTISVTPKVYSSSENLRSIPIQSRKCMFQDEGNLRWSSKYTFSNCINECFTKSIFKYCNCIPFYYPSDNSSRKFCTLEDVACLHKNQFNYSALIDPNDFSKFPENINEDESTIMDCKCYPQCNENMLNFHTDQSKTKIQDNVSILHVFYDDIGCIKTEREIYFTWDRVLASIGGIFGLCIGGSLISILEIIYFVVKSLICCKENKTKNNVQYFNHHRQKNDGHNLKKRSAKQLTINLQ